MVPSVVLGAVRVEERLHVNGGVREGVGGVLAKNDAAGDGVGELGDGGHLRTVFVADVGACQSIKKAVSKQCALPKIPLC